MVQKYYFLSINQNKKKHQHKYSEALVGIGGRYIHTHTHIYTYTILPEVLGHPCKSVNSGVPIIYIMYKIKHHGHGFLQTFVIEWVAPRSSVNSSMAP